MNDAHSLRSRQEPIKKQYRDHPESARVSMHACGEIDPQNLVCNVQAFQGAIPAGLHPAAGGSGREACSGDMLLQSLVACAGVTLAAVANAMGINLRPSKVLAEGEMDFRGTLGIDRQAPVGITAIRLRFEIDADATDQQIDKLVELTERYCVIYQTLCTSVAIHSEVAGR